ncbi:sigma 54-interacting transcriptional regulator [Clostridium sp. CCUG 7971]|uniref:sigma-54 interaction domain-containing protein n=1 Tax=Clostridium sp. CCUG 7971 TaxID=2811414 RepID=UPI001ABBC25C|nr:sigma 54-interacting transcriptional regulator [Clostridium sp. CCUG 7971]MBO3444637.1 sigma 54-interacting transcriptional regulator [Clostridium sp. CCUG 7971]
MKKIAVISLGEDTGLTIKEQLESILDEKIDINVFGIDNNLDINPDWDLIIFSSEIVRKMMLDKLGANVNQIVVKRSIRHNFIDKLIKIKKGEKVLLVNDHKESCEISIKQLKNQGIDHIQYFPYYPGIGSYEKTNIAVTPGESQLVPKEIKEVIDIQSRQMDIISITEILIKLNMVDKYGDLLSSYFYRNIVEISKKYINMAHESTKLKNMLTSILDNQREGIIYTNSTNQVLVLNEKAVQFLNIDRNNIISKDIYNVFDDLKNDIVKINNQELLISKQKIGNDGNYVGNMIVISQVDNIHKIDEELRKKKKNIKNSSKYTFDNIIGSCKNTLESIKLSKKISKTNSTVLIQGETGTGKEVLAQAIHNESERRDYPFIAVNFAALSENLIESELFGYEEGAFTGAKKGGKEGLFKKAHKGTIFLDEIGDAPLNLQARLLRVLQEREITPVGSTDVIPVDIRIIAATNKNLLDEVKNKNFREDLYYRLNVMPIYTIPLRDRKEDISLTLNYYISKFNKHYDIEKFFEEDVIRVLEDYNWPGNVRELINIVEYLSSIKEDNLKIEVSDLPKYILDNINIKSDKYKTEDDLTEDELWVLKTIYKYDSIGRRTLSMISYEEGIDLGEGKLRRIINILKEKEYIDVNKGLNGTKITNNGIKRVEN